MKLGGSELELTYGLDLLRQRYYRPVVDPASGGEVINFISPEVSLDSAAVFVQPQWRSGPWLFTGGVRHERFRGEVGSEDFDADLPNASAPGDIPDFSLTLFNLGFVYDIGDAAALRRLQPGRGDQRIRARGAWRDGPRADQPRGGQV